MATAKSSAKGTGALAALRAKDPEAWRARVRTALERAGSLTDAAPLLEVSRATLYIWSREARAAGQPLEEGLELRKVGRPWPSKPAPAKRARKK